MSDMRFEFWLACNYELWLDFCRLADEARAKRGKWSARAIIDVLRWDRMRADRIDADFKLNNNWGADMARKYNKDRGVDFFVLRARGARNHNNRSYME